MDESDEGSQGTVGEDESDQEEGAGPYGFPQGTVINTVTIDGVIVEEAILPPGFTPTLSPSLMDILTTAVSERAPSSFDEEKAITTYSSGPETAGSKIVLPDGTAIQLPENAYIDAWYPSVHCFVGQEICPVSPLYVIAQGDARIAVDGEGVVRFSFDEARGSSTPGDFDFLKHLITDPDELWNTNT